MPHSCVTVSRCHTSLGANTYACKLIVPRLAYNAYVRHAYWGQFSIIVPSSEMESSAPEIYVNPANPELADPERVAYWQPLFEKQFKRPKQGEKHYATLRGFVIA